MTLAATDDTARILLTCPADERPVRYGAALAGLERLGEVRLDPARRG